MLKTLENKKRILLNMLRDQRLIQMGHLPPAHVRLLEQDLKEAKALLGLNRAAKISDIDDVDEAIVEARRVRDQRVRNQQRGVAATCDYCGRRIHSSFLTTDVKTRMKVCPSCEKHIVGVRAKPLRDPARHEYTIQIVEKPGDARHSGFFRAFSRGKVGTGVSAQRAFYNLQTRLGLRGAYLLPRNYREGTTFKMRMK